MSFTPDPIRAPLSSVPRGWVTVAALALVLAALVGTGLGIVRSLGAHDLPSDTGELAPVPNTTLAKALPADAVFDESRIRAIAREEAQAALVRTAPKPKAPPKDETASDAASDGAEAPSPVLSTPKMPALTSLKPTVSVSPRGGSSTPTTNPYPPGLNPN